MDTQPMTDNDKTPAAPQANAPGIAAQVPGSGPSLSDELHWFFHDEFGPNCGPRTARLVEMMRDRLEDGQRWKLAHETVRDERAKSFKRLSRLIGGIGCTEYQAEVDIEIECRVRSIIESLRVTNAELFAMVARFGDELATEYRSRLLDLYEQNEASLKAAARAQNPK